MKKCMYCNPDYLAGEQIVFENEYCMYLQMKNPEIEGSGIVVQKLHKETVFDLSLEEWNATYELLQEIKAYTDRKYTPDGYNIGWNCGDAGGQHVYHSHMHVIPRFKDEPMAGKGIRYLFKSAENQRRNK